MDLITIVPDRAFAGPALPGPDSRIVVCQRNGGPLPAYWWRFGGAVSRVEGADIWLVAFQSDVAGSCCNRTTTSHAWQYASADIEDAVQVHARYASVPYGGSHAPDSGPPPGDIGAINRLLSIGVLVLAGLSCFFLLPWRALPTVADRYIQTARG